MIGKFKGIPFELETISVKDGDTLIVKADQDKIDIDVAIELYDGICNMYPNNKVIYMMEGMTLVKESGEETT